MYVGCAGCQQSGLGLTTGSLFGGTATGAAAGSAAGPVGTAVGAVAGFLSSIFSSSSDPVKDAQRKAIVDQAYAGAMAGNQQDFNCLKEMAQGVARPPNDPRTCALGSQIGAAYAKLKYAEFTARHAAGLVGGTLIGVSDIGSSAVGGALSALTSPVMLAGIAVAAYFLLSRRGR